MKCLEAGAAERVAIARAIVNDAPIILADEPTGNLDTKTSRNYGFFRETYEQGKKTIILVTPPLFLHTQQYPIRELLK